MAEAKDSARLQRELIKITDTPGPRVQPLKAPAPRAAIGQSKGEAPISRSSSGGGISSPLVEKDTPPREAHPLVSTRTTDGLFTFYYRMSKKITMLDGQGREVVFEYKVQA